MGTEWHGVQRGDSVNTEVDSQPRVAFPGENVPAHYEEGLYAELSKDTRLAGRGNDLPFHGYIQWHQSGRSHIKDARIRPHG